MRQDEYEPADLAQVGLTSLGLVHRRHVRRDSKLAHARIWWQSSVQQARHWFAVMLGGALMQISFKGKKVIVTGGSRGIGRSIAFAFAMDGADLAICARGIEGARSTETELRRHGGTVFGTACRRLWWMAVSH
jgi:hypothetical protein